MRYPTHLALRTTTRGAIATCRSHRSRNNLLSRRLMLSCGVPLQLATSDLRHQAQLQLLHTLVTRS
jgi:hypothetical protein